MKALLIDLDGTLFESELWNFESWRLIRTLNGLETPIVLWRKFVQRQTEWTPYDGLVIDEANLSVVSAARRQFMSSMFSISGPTMGAKALVRAAQSLGVSVAVVTNRDPASAEVLVGQTGLDVSLVVAAEPSRKKPDPEPYMRALSLLGVEPTQAIAVEDSPDGARSSVGAGVKTYVLPNWLWHWNEFPKECNIVEGFDEVEAYIGQHAARSFECPD